MPLQPLNDWAVPSELYEKIKADLSQSTDPSASLFDLSKSKNVPWPAGSKVNPIHRNDGRFGFFVRAPSGEYMSFLLVPAA